MSGVYVSGLGVVSPAGWGLESFRRVLAEGEPLPVSDAAPPGYGRRLPVRLVPAPTLRMAFLRHPRLRRSSPATHYAAAAVLEALEGAGWVEVPAGFRLGLIVVHQCGCVQYTCRFYAELLEDPRGASPLLFPETVFNAPASHLAVVLGATGRILTLVGDAATVLEALALGAGWLGAGELDGVVVVGVEEPHWLLADAARHLEAGVIRAYGAGALLLTVEPRGPQPIQLEVVTDVFTERGREVAGAAARAVRQVLDLNPGCDVLVEGRPAVARGRSRAPSAWVDWTGCRICPGAILGEGLTAGVAWQCVAAGDALVARRQGQAGVCASGDGCRSIGARFSLATARQTGAGVECPAPSCGS